ncbi:MAG: hypothetical protein H7326_10540 [Bdellovibrionaceae bacterium]|nr:hypothetical protein [Pseudobdellovibrionaceae bacterium]
MRALIFVLIYWSSSAFAQGMQNQTQWGTGEYGGMQSCNVPQLAGVGATNVLDEVRELLGSEKDLKRELSDQKKTKRELDKEVTELKRVI